MTSAASRQSRVSIAIVVTAIAAAPAAAAGFMYFKDSPIVGEVAGGKGPNRIAVESWTWGPAATIGPNGKWIVVEREMKQSGDPDRPLVAGRVPSPVEREMKESGEKGGTEDINIGVGELQEATISKSMDRANTNLTQFALIGSARTGSASRGGLTVKAPRGTCKVGRRYPAVDLQGGQRFYTMTGVVVTGCTASSADGSIPTETLSLNFDKITWKYWP